MDVPLLGDANNRKRGSLWNKASQSLHHQLTVPNQYWYVKQISSKGNVESQTAAKCTFGSTQIHDLAMSWRNRIEQSSNMWMRTSHSKRATNHAWPYVSGCLFAPTIGIGCGYCLPTVGCRRANKAPPSLMRTALDLHPVGMSIMPKRLHIRSKRQLHCQLPYESLWSTMLRLLQAAVLLWHLVFLSCSGVLRLSSVKKYNDNHCTRNAHIYKCLCIRVFVSEWKKMHVNIIILNI